MANDQHFCCELTWKLKIHQNDCQYNYCHNIILWTHEPQRSMSWKGSEDWELESFRCRKLLRNVTELSSHFDSYSARRHSGCSQKVSIPCEKKSCLARICSNILRRDFFFLHILKAWRKIIFITIFLAGVVYIDLADGRRKSKVRSKVDVMVW